MVVTMKAVMVTKVSVMSASKYLKLLILIALLSYSCYKLGQGNPIIVKETVEVKVYDQVSVHLATKIIAGMRCM